MFGDSIVDTIKAIRGGPNPKGVLPIKEEGVREYLAPVKARNNVRGPPSTRRRNNTQT
jgi:hypothetical protein